MSGRNLRLPEQADLLVELIPEPYATMVYVAIYTGLRISELAGLKWGDIHEDSITLDERFAGAIGARRRVSAPMQRSR